LKLVLIALFVSVMQDQPRFGFQSCRIEFVGHFAKSIFNERSLQRRFFALNPTSQDKFADGDRVLRRTGSKPFR